VTRGRLILAGLAFSAVLGCQLPTLPDPNDPTNAGVMAPDILRRNLSGAADAFFDRVRRGEISEQEGKRMLAEYATGLLNDVRPEQVSPDRAWEYAEVLMTANRWKEARSMLEIAVKNPPTEDRRVNDNLRLARCQAMLGDVKTAITTACSTFDAKPNDKAPILMAVYLEIAPAGEGKGEDLELGQLIDDAIEQGKQTTVDVNTEAGKNFAFALKFHIRAAYIKAAELYDRAGRADLAERDRSKAQAISRNG
jgi:tetratricopeptide (TPR) repeat protein